MVRRLHGVALPAALRSVLRRARPLPRPSSPAAGQQWLSSVLVEGRHQASSAASGAWNSGSHPSRPARRIGSGAASGRDPFRTCSGRFPSRPPRRSTPRHLAPICRPGRWTATRRTAELRAGQSTSGATVCVQRPMTRSTSLASVPDRRPVGHDVHAAVCMRWSRSWCPAGSAKKSWSGRQNRSWSTSRRPQRRSASDSASPTTRCQRS